MAGFEKYEKGARKSKEQKRTEQESKKQKTLKIVFSVCVVIFTVAMYLAFGFFLMCLRNAFRFFSYLL